MDEIQRSIPRSVRQALAKRDIDVKQARAVAVADISEDNALQRTYVLLFADRLVTAQSDQTGVMTFTGRGMSVPRGLRRPKSAIRPAETKAEGLAAVSIYALSRLSRPRILNQVIGGVLIAAVDDEETRLCRFSGAHMRDMQRLCTMLDCAIKHEDPPPAPPVEQIVCPRCGQPYPERERAVCPHCTVKRTVFARCLSYFRPYKARMALVLVCVTVSGLMGLVSPYLTGTVLYDHVLARDPGFLSYIQTGSNRYLVLLGWLVAAMVIARVIQQGTGILHSRTTAYIAPGIACRMKSDVFGALQRLSLGFFTRRQTGGLMKRVNDDANQVMDFFINGLPYILFNVLTFVVTAVIMFTIDWRLALVSLALLPPLFCISYWLLPRCWNAWGHRWRVIRSMYSLLNDDIGGARVVKAFGQQAHENQRFEKVNERTRDADMQVVRYENGFDIAYGLANAVPQVLVMSVGALIILLSPADGFSYGKLITFTNYLAMLQGPMIFFSDVFRWWAYCMESAQRVFEIIDARPDVQESETPLHPKIRGAVSLRNVSFSYEPNRPVLKDINLDIREGEMLGIVGKSGAGKSTLVNLISRLYDPDSGTVTIDGIDVKELAFTCLHGAVAMVSQETYIFMGTIAENIAYARPDATHEEIVRAAQAASAHSFICRLPEGYDTRIGAGGRDLSGGERQRISIARAILADPRILVLDEATASVDTETERAIQASLDRLIHGRTTISIAHRLSTLRSADHLVVLEEGKLVESGTHAELVALRGVYYKLLQLQSKALAMRGVGD